MRTAVFDLDGTLADTSADLIGAANAALDGLGVAGRLDVGNDAAVAFAGGRAMLRLGFARSGLAPDEAAVDAAFPVLIAHYAAHIDDHTMLYPGAAQALDRLAAAGWRLAVCTNKPEGLARELLARLGIRDRFAAITGADTLPVRKPDPLHLTETVARAGGAVSRAVLIGDTITDRKAAANAGVPCVLVTFGPEGDGVTAMSPEGLLDHYDRIEAVLDAVLGA